MYEFLQYLAKANMTDGEKEIAYNLTTIYMFSILSMVLLYRFFFSASKAQPRNATPDAETSTSLLPNVEQVVNLIKHRRSIMPKSLTGDRLNQQQIDTLLDAANWAPTHKNTEPWRYVVIGGSEGLGDYLDWINTWYQQHLEELEGNEYETYCKKYEGAAKAWPEKVSHAIIIGMERDNSLPEWEEICAVAMSVQNLHLTVAAMPGVAGFWSSHTWCKRARDSKEMARYLGIAENGRVFGAFLLGKVTDGKYKSRRSDWREKVQWRGDCVE